MSQPFPNQSQPWQQPPPTVQNNPYAAWQTQAAFSKSFTTPALICLLLYIFLWIPGAIANCMYLIEARKVKNLIGVSPDGYGCLWTLFAFFVILPLIGGSGFFLIMLITGATVTH